MNDSQLWSWIVTIVGVIGWYFVGKKYWWAWFIGLGAQVLWAVYATVSHQPAFYISVVLYTTIYSKNLWSWWKEHREKKARRDNSEKHLHFDYGTDLKASPIQQHFGTWNLPSNHSGTSFSPDVSVVPVQFFTFAERQDSEDFIPTEEKLWQDVKTRYGILRDGLKTKHLQRVFDEKARDIIREEYGFHS